MPARFVNVEKSLKVHKQIAVMCAVSLGASLIALASCQSKLKKSVPVIDTRITCINMKPITYIKSDSDRTKAQIIVHNKTWEYFCERQDQ